MTDSTSKNQNGNTSLIEYVDSSVQICQPDKPLNIASRESDAGKKERGRSASNAWAGGKNYQEDHIEKETICTHCNASVSHPKKRKCDCAHVNKWMEF